MVSLYWIAVLRDNLLNLSSGPSWRDLAISVIYLYEQGAHAPDPQLAGPGAAQEADVAGLAAARALALLQESLEHLRNGGLGEVHIMDVVGT